VQTSCISIILYYTHILLIPAVYFPHTLYALCIGTRNLTNKFHVIGTKYFT